MKITTAIAYQFWQPPSEGEDKNFLNMDLNPLDLYNNK